MVIPDKSSRAERAMLTVDLIVAIGILMIAVLPLGYSFIRDGRALRSTYQRAVAMEIVDGEMEILAAGAWRALPEGTHDYAVRATAAQNLPPGKFQSTREGSRIRLEWRSEKKAGVGVVARETNVK